MQHIWILFILVNYKNVLVLRKRFKISSENDPSLKDGYDKILRAILIYGNIPWVIIGIGNLTGITQSIFDYFSPRTMNPAVLTFHLSIIVIWVLSSKWIFFGDGAEFLARHQGLIRIKGPVLNKDITSPGKIKLFCALCLLGGLLGMTMMWVMNIPPITPFK